MAGLEPGSSGGGSDHSVTFATTGFKPESALPQPMPILSRVCYVKSSYSLIKTVTCITPWYSNEAFSFWFSNIIALLISITVSLGI